MAVSKFTPSEQLVGEELSTATRLVEATKLRETAGTKDEEQHELAAACVDALLAGEGMDVKGIEALKDLAEKYKEAGEKQKMDPHPNVKSPELLNLISRLEGFLDQSKLEDKQGGKKSKHPAANLPGKEPKKKEKPNDVPGQPVAIVETPETRKAQTDANKGKSK